VLNSARASSLHPDSSPLTQLRYLIVPSTPLAGSAKSYEIADIIEKDTYLRKAYARMFLGEHVFPKLKKPKITAIALFVEES